MAANPIEHKEFADLAKSGNLDSVRVVARGRTWSVLASARQQIYSVASQRGGLREFSKLDTAARYLSSLGIEKFSVDHSGYDELAKPRRSRPDAAAKLRQAHEAATHDAWFREQVEFGLKEADDPNTRWYTVEEVEAEDDALFAELEHEADEQSA